MAIVDLLKYLIYKSEVSDAFIAFLREFKDLFRNLENDIMYIGSLAENLLTIIEKYNVKLCGSLSTIEAEKLFSARTGQHYNEQIINYRSETNFITERYNFHHEVIINRNLQVDAYQNEANEHS
jgi:hypothetical protein